MRLSASCINLLLAFGPTLVAQPSQDADALQKACDAGAAEVCSTLARRYGAGILGVPKDPTRAAQLYQKACDGGYANGCLYLGLLYQMGEGVPKDPVRAAQLLQRADEMGDGGAAVDEGAPTAFGTGWVVRGGYVVTNHHVVAGATKVRLLLATGVSIRAQAVVSDTTNDLVLLKPEDPARLPAPLPLATGAARSGETVFTIGHPYPTLLGSEAKVTDGVISATSGLGNDPRLLQVSVPIQPGNSGGPLLNMRGEVVGIVISKLNAAEVFRWSGDLPENVGYAIKSAYLVPLLPEQAAVASPTSAAGQGLADLVARLKPSIVLIVADRPEFPPEVIHLDEASPATPPPTPPAAPRELYSQAYADFARGNYQRAEYWFREFIRYYPGTDFSDNAQYWIGESRYSRGQYESALEAWKLLFRDYPASDKLPDAHLKSGMALERLGRSSQALVEYGFVIERYPGSQAAQAARVARERMSARPAR